MLERIEIVESDRDVLPRATAGGVDRGGLSATSRSKPVFFPQPLLSSCRDKAARSRKWPYVVEIEHAEIGDEPLRPEFQNDPNYRPSAAVHGAMTETGDKVAAFNDPVATLFFQAGAVSQRWRRRPQRQALGVAGQIAAAAAARQLECQLLVPQVSSHWHCPRRSIWRPDRNMRPMRPAGGEIEEFARCPARIRRRGRGPSRSKSG